MLVFWKKNEKEERELRKKAEKEALERLRIEEERREAKRQARKLNFLITQTELYSHFIGKKIKGAEWAHCSKSSITNLWLTHLTKSFIGTADEDSETAVEANASQAESSAAANVDNGDLELDSGAAPVLEEINFDEGQYLTLVR